MLQQKVQDDMKNALRTRDEVRLSVTRGLLASFTNELVATKRKPTDQLPDDDAMKVIQRNAKQRKEAAEQYRIGGREDLAEQEEKELAILKEYLPEMLGRDDIQKIAGKKKEELGITERSQMGQLMGAVMKEVKGRAEGNDVKAVVEGLFT